MRMNGKVNSERRKNVKRFHKLRAIETVKHIQHGKVEHNRDVPLFNFLRLISVKPSQVES